MAQTKQSNIMDNDSMSNSNGEAVVHLSKHQEEKQTAESSAFEQVMQQMNIADRKTFDAKYAEMWNEASERNEMLSLMICEIDFFKDYHENYGHQGASFMLLVIALALKTTCEEYDCFLGRYKGDEFGILFKGGDPQKAQEVAEKLRTAVEKSRTEHKFSSVSNIVTLSIGLSSFYPTSMQVVMNQASSALSNAQSTGHNKVSAPTAKSTATSAPTETVAAPQQEPQAKVIPQEPIIEELKPEQPPQAKIKTEESFAEESNKAAVEAKNAELLKQQEEELRRKEEEEFLRKQEEEEFLRKQEEEDRKKREAPGYFDMDNFF